VQNLRGEILNLGYHLHPRVAAAGDHVGEVLRADLGLVDCLCYLEASQHRVTQVERLEDALETDRVVGQPGDRQVSRD
jgi:hypothetical protein